MPSCLRLHLLNEFRLFIDEQPVEGFYQPRLQALLAYLALHRTPQPRHRIAVNFWLDSSEKQAHTNLRKLIHRLLQQLPEIETWMVLGRQELGLRTGAAMTSDVGELTQALDELEAVIAPPDAPIPFDPALVEAVTRRYPGELLPTCYDEWLLPLRDELHTRVIHTLHSALALLENRQAYTVGIRCAGFLLRLDPLHEETYQRLMRFHALHGDRAAALQVYRTCVHQLAAELDVPPSPATEALYARVQQADIEPQPARSIGTSGVSADLMHATSIAAEPAMPLLGRAAEWRALLDAWQQTTLRGAHFCLIWGEAGMGKTRLAEALRQYAALRPGTLAVARAYAAEGSLPYAPVTTWLRSAGIHPALAQLAPQWRTEIARLLPELQQADPTLPPPQTMTESWQQQRFREALARLFPLLPGPCLLILDDMQWCDVETLRWLRYLLRFDPRLPLLVVGTARNEATLPPHPLHELIQQLHRDHQISRIELGPLDADAAAALVRHLVAAATQPDATQPDASRPDATQLATELATELATKLATELATEAEGNPLFIVEMVRARPAVATAPATAQATAEPATLPVALPATVHAVIATRLDQLSPPAQHVAELAAAIGRTFDATLLETTQLVSEDHLITGLDELWQRRILRERSGIYEFSHDKIREVAYAAVPPMQRRRLHSRIAQALEALYAADLAPVWSQLAHHYSEAQQPQTALPYLLHMAEQAEALDAYVDAATLYARALALHEAMQPPDPAGAFDLRERRATLLERAGDTAVQAQDVAAMFELARKLDDPNRRAQAHIRQAAYLSGKRDVAGAVQAGEAALALYRAAGNSAGEIQAQRELGLICWAARDPARALQYGRAVLQLHRRHSDIMGEATALHNLAEIYRSLHSPQQAVTLYQQALQLYWGRQDQRSQAITLYGLAAAYRQLARPEDALDAYRQAETLCVQAADRLIRSRVHHAMGILHWELGQAEAARAAMRQAVTLSEAIGHLPNVAYSQVALGYMAAHPSEQAGERGSDPDSAQDSIQDSARQEAIDRFQAALTTLRRMNDMDGAGEVQARLDLLHQGRSDLPEPPASLQWLRSHVVLTDWKVYCEVELPHLAATGRRDG